MIKIYRIIPQAPLFCGSFSMRLSAQDELVLDVQDEMKEASFLQDRAKALFMTPLSIAIITSDIDDSIDYAYLQLAEPSGPYDTTSWYVAHTDSEGIVTTSEVQPYFGAGGADNWLPSSIEQEVSAYALLNRTPNVVTSVSDNYADSVIHAVVFQSATIPATGSYQFTKNGYQYKISCTPENYGKGLGPINKVSSITMDFDPVTMVCNEVYPMSSDISSTADYGYSYYTIEVLQLSSGLSFTTSVSEP